MVTLDGVELGEEFGIGSNALGNLRCSGERVDRAFHVAIELCEVCDQANSLSAVFGDKEGR